MIKSFSISFIFLVFVLVACKKEIGIETKSGVLYAIDLPAHFPEIEVPRDNPMTVSSVELGRLLFNSKKLSRDETVSCATCHLQSEAFSDHHPVAIGSQQRKGMRNVPTLTNVAFQKRFHWDGGVPSLELQVMAPIHNENEMDFLILEAVERLRKDTNLQKLSQKAYGQDINPFVITRAIASFERTLISSSSTYDQWLATNQDGAFTMEEKIGKDLFFSEKTQCASCHSGVNFTDGEYYNIGLYENYTDIGREGISLLTEDQGKFKVPTLRNIALTAPYMHDGSIETLEEVIDFLATGGANHPNKSNKIQSLDLQKEEKEALVAFLKTLSDHKFVKE